MKRTRSQRSLLDVWKDAGSSHERDETDDQMTLDLSRDSDSDDEDDADQDEPLYLWRLLLCAQLCAVMKINKSISHRSPSRQLKHEGS